jgi:hypothetical protein
MTPLSGRGRGDFHIPHKTIPLLQFFFSRNSKTGINVSATKGPFHAMSCTVGPQETALFMPPASCTLENEPLVVLAIGKLSLEPKKTTKWIKIRA